MTRRLAITKRVDLSDVAEGWEGCYGLITAATYDELSEISKMDLDVKTDDEKAAQGYSYLERASELVKKHFVSGRVMVLNEANEFVQDDMQADDIDEDIELTNRFIAAVTGVILDPKASSTPSPEKSETKPASTEQ